MTHRAARSQRLRRTAVAAAAVATAAVTVGPAVAGGAGTRQVAVKDTLFTPRTVTIARGDTVRWAWKGDLGHDVYFRNKSVQPRSRELRPKTAGSYRLTFKRRGTFTYICTVHVGDRMRGTVVVR